MSGFSQMKSESTGTDAESTAASGNPQDFFMWEAQPAAGTTVTAGAVNGAAGTTSVAGEWSCECGAVNTGKFCSECGKPKPIINTRVDL